MSTTSRSDAGAASGVSASASDAHVLHLVRARIRRLRPRPRPRVSAPGARRDCARRFRAAALRSQKRWILFLRHASKCGAQEGCCPIMSQCHKGRELWLHLLGCQDPACPFPKCVESRTLLRHYQKCEDQACPICPPVRLYIEADKQQRA